MKQWTALLLALLALSSLALAQSQPTVSGFVFAKGSGEPLEGAEVTVVGGKTNDAVTDSDGTFILTFPGDVKPGSPIRIHIEKPGYSSVTKTIPFSSAIPMRVGLERIKGISRKRPVQPTPSPAPDLGATGFLQLEPPRFAEQYSTLLANKQLAVNFVYSNPGPYPITDRHSFEWVSFPNRSDLPNNEGFRESERVIVADFKEHQQEKYARNRDYPTAQLGKDQALLTSVGLVPIPPLTEEQVSGILDGSTRIYVLAWATWKDSRNKVGSLSVCYWLQAPKSRDLLSGLVWHSCAEPLLIDSTPTTTPPTEKLEHSAASDHPKPKPVLNWQGYMGHHPITPEFFTVSTSEYPPSPAGEGTLSLYLENEGNANLTRARLYIRYESEYEVTSEESKPIPIEPEREVRGISMEIPLIRPAPAEPFRFILKIKHFNNQMMMLYCEVDADEIPVPLKFTPLKVVRTGSPQ
jgi:hypothetical protein